MRSDDHSQNLPLRFSISRQKPEEPGRGRKHGFKIGATAVRESRQLLALG